MENNSQEETRFVAYYRVSTRKQDLGLEAQQATARAFVSTRGASLLAEYSEKESGKRENLQNRIELQRALEECKRQNCTLLVAKLDRLARDAEFIFHLLNSGAKFTACDLPVFNTVTAGVMAIMAQHERECCSRRTKEALQAKKAHGTKLGSRNGVSHVYDEEDRLKAWKANTDKANGNENNRKAWHFIKSSYETKTLQELADALTSEHYSTSTGRKGWKPAQVARLIKRFA